MPHANWYSQPDRDMPSFGNFDPSLVADDETRFQLERIREELAQFGRGCETPLYGVRAECWMPNVGRIRYGYYMADFNETVLSAPESGKRTVVLPDAVSRPGGSVEIIDRTGNAATSIITVKTIKAQTIARASTYTISTNNAGVIFRSDGENWWAIAASGVGTGSGNVIVDGDDTNAVMAATDHMSIAVEANTRYQFEAWIDIEADADFAFDFDGGTATMTSIKYVLELISATGTAGSTVVSTGVTALATLTTVSVAAGTLILRGHLNVNAGGTFVMRHGGSGAGGEVVKDGSWMRLTKC